MPYLGLAPTTGENNNFRILDDITSYTLTFDGSSSSVVSTSGNTITENNHRFVQGQRVTYNNGGGSNIGGLTSGTAYFVYKSDKNSIGLATNASNAASGSLINLSSVGGGGSHTLNIAFDGTNTKFKATYNNGTLAKMTRAAQLQLSVNGVIQQPFDTTSPSNGFGFDVDSVIIFSTAPASTDSFWGHLYANNNPTYDIADNKVDAFVGTGSTTDFTLSKNSINNENLLVTIDGVVQYPTIGNSVRAYTTVDNVIKFTAAPGSGVDIQVRHIGFAGANSDSGVTAFYGRTGNVTLLTSDNINTGNIVSSGNISAVNGTLSGTLGVTGNATFDGTLGVTGNATFDGNVSIAKTLTYEDVTNIDSVGLITARSGLRVLNGSALFDTENANPTANNADGTAILDGGGIRISKDGEPLGLNRGGSDGIMIDMRRDGTSKSALAIDSNDLIMYSYVSGSGYERFRIKDTGNIGISTNAPYSQLTAYGENKSDGGSATGQITAKDNAAYNASPVGGLIFQGHYHSNGANAVFGGITGGKLTTAEGNYDSFLALHTRKHGAVAYEAVRIDQDGKVGIGTTLPSQPLHILSSSTGLRVHRDNQWLTVNANYGGQEHCALEFTGALSLFPGGGTEKARMLANGSIGIGRTNPSFKLHINTTATNSTQVVGLCIANDASSSGVGGKINLGAANGFDSTSAGISGWYDGTGTSLSLFTSTTYANTNHVERLRITNTGQLHMGGGSGWTYASQKFVVVEPNNNLGMLLQGNHANEGVNLTLQNIVNANNAYSSLSFADDGGQIFGIVRGKVNDKNANTGELQFHTSGSHRLTIDKDGDVGIGETLPGANNEKLTVREDIAAASGKAIISIFNLYQGTSGQSNASTGALEFTFKNHNASHNWWGGRIACYNTDNYNQYTYLSFDTASQGNAAEKMRLTHDGKLGIGTATPSKMLTVRGTILKTRTDSGLGLIYLTNDGSQNGLININQNGGVTRIKLDSASTSYFNGGPLVVGATSSQASDAVTMMSDGEVTAAGFYFSNNIGSPMNSDGFRRHTTGTICIDTGTAERVRIDSNGYLKLSGRNVQGSADGDKLLRIYQPSRTDAEEDVLLLQSHNTNTENWMTIGGGDSSFNAATDIAFRTAAVNTVSGTQRVRIHSDGAVSINSTDDNIHRIKIGYKTGQSLRTYANGGTDEGFMINVDRQDSSNFEGTVDLVAGRGSDNTNGGSQFRIWTQHRAAGTVPRMRIRIPRDGKVRIGHNVFRSDNDCTSNNSVWYDHKVGGNVTQSEHEVCDPLEPTTGYGKPNYGTPFVYTLQTPNTDSDAANRFYPVSINTPGCDGGGTIGTFWISRKYWSTGPAQLGGSTIGWTGSSTHQGGLDSHFQVRELAWSDKYDMRLLHHRYSYHETIQTMGMYASYSATYGSGPFYLMLRGGFQYNFYGNYPIHPANVEPGGRVYSTSYAWFWPATSTSGASAPFNAQYYTGTS